MSGTRQTPPRISRDEVAHVARLALLELSDAELDEFTGQLGAVLAHAGGGFDDVVSVIVYVTELSELGTIHEVRREFFTPPYPASTLIEVTALVFPELLIEISAVAVIADDRARLEA